MRNSVPKTPLSLERLNHSWRRRSREWGRMRGPILRAQARRRSGRATSSGAGCGRSPASRPGAVRRVPTGLVHPRSPADYHRPGHAPGRLMGARRGGLAVGLVGLPIRLPRSSTSPPGEPCKASLMNQTWRLESAEHRRLRESPSGRSGGQTRSPGSSLSFGFRRRRMSSRDRSSRTQPSGL